MQVNKRLSLLLSNMMVYGMNQVVVVLIPMIMLPIYSRMLPNIDIYGASSLVTTICTLASAIAIFGMFDAAVRFAFDKDEQNYKISVCSTATFFMILTSVIVFIILIAFRKYASIIFFGNQNYEKLIIISAFMVIFSVWNSAALIPIRITNKRKIAVINSIIKVIGTAIATIVLLILKQYMIAIPLGTVIGLICSWIFSFFLIQKKYLQINFFDKILFKKMFKYAAPLMITFTSYWIYQSSDKIMLSHISNLKEVGIYTIGAKVGAVAGVLQNAFASGWSFFAFSTMNDSDQVSFISRIYRIFQLICFICSFLILAFIYPIFNILFVNNEYIMGASICSALFLAPLQLTLMQILGTQMFINKDTKIYSVVQFIGAIVNIIFNVIFIPIFGARGAAVSTLIGYVVPLIMLIIFLIYQRKIIIEFKTIAFLIASTTLIVFSTLFIYNYKINMLLGVVAIFLSIVIFFEDVTKILEYICGYLKLPKTKK